MDWYFDMGVREISSTESRYGFGWGKPPGATMDRYTGLPAGMCISAEKANADLEGAGWTLSRKAGGKIPSGDGPWLSVPESMYDHKGRRGRMMTELRGGCLARISIEATELPDF